MSTLDHDSLYLRSSPDAVVVVDESGVIELVNPRVEEMFGYDAAQLIGQPVEILIPAHQAKAHRAHRTRYRVAPTTRAMGQPGLDLFGRRADGTDFPVEISLSPVNTDSKAHVMACVRDITDRRALEERGRADREALRIAEDRERIARDLHDVVIQRLFATGMRLQAGLADSDRLGDRVDEAVVELDETIAGIRRSIFDLTDSATKTPSQRIQAVVDAHTDRAGVTVDVDLSGDVNGIDHDVMTGLEASLTEALSNVARHAAATTTRVSVSVGGDVVMRVSDDGVGIPETRETGYGLPNMGARAVDLGGELSVSAGPDGGTELVWRVPADQRQQL